MQFAQNVLKFGNGTQGARTFLAPVNDAHGQNGRDDELNLSIFHANSPSSVCVATADESESGAPSNRASGERSRALPKGDA